MKILIYLYAFLVSIFIISGMFLTSTRFFIQSPDQTKYLTLYRGFYQFNSPYYLVVGKYLDILPPKDNYCTLTLSSDPKPLTLKIQINWKPADKSYVKIIANCVDIKESTRLFMNPDNKSDLNMFFDDVEFIDEYLKNFRNLNEMKYQILMSSLYDSEKGEFLRIMVSVSFCVELLIYILSFLIIFLFIVLFIYKWVETRSKLEEAEL